MQRLFQPALLEKFHCDDEGLVKQATGDGAVTWVDVLFSCRPVLAPSSVVVSVLLSAWPRLLTICGDPVGLAVCVGRFALPVAPDYADVFCRSPC
eukprot:7360766-Alexandrium_andersonii.AAC.1